MGAILLKLIKTPIALGGFEQSDGCKLKSNLIIRGLFLDQNFE